MNALIIWPVLPQTLSATPLGLFPKSGAILPRNLGGHWGQNLFPSPQENPASRQLIGSGEGLAFTVLFIFRVCVSLRRREYNAVSQVATEPQRNRRAEESQVFLSPLTSLSLTFS